MKDYTSIHSQRVYGFLICVGCTIFFGFLSSLFGTACSASGCHMCMSHMATIITIQFCGRSADADKICRPVCVRKHLCALQVIHVEVSVVSFCSPDKAAEIIALHAARCS